jgi:hypothetical protein
MVRALEVRTIFGINGKWVEKWYALICHSSFSPSGKISKI